MSLLLDCFREYFALSVSAQLSRGKWCAFRLCRYVFGRGGVFVGRSDWICIPRATANLRKREYYRARWCLANRSGLDEWLCSYLKTGRRGIGAWTWGALALAPLQHGRSFRRSYGEAMCGEDSRLRQILLFEDFPGHQPHSEQIYFSSYISSQCTGPD